MNLQHKAYDQILLAYADMRLAEAKTEEVLERLDVAEAMLKRNDGSPNTYAVAARQLAAEVHGVVRAFAVYAVHLELMADLIEGKTGTGIEVVDATGK